MKTAKISTKLNKNKSRLKAQKLWLDFVLQLIYILKRNGDGGDPEIASQKNFKLSAQKLQPINTSSYQPRNCIIKHSFKLPEIQQL